MPRGSDPAEKRNESTEPGFQALFDGRTLAGWRGWESPSPPASCRVEDGAIIGKGKTVLLTEQEFDDYELRLDWKVDAKGNGGVLNRIPSAGAKGDVPIGGMECQLIYPGYSGAAETRTGALFNLVPALKTFTGAADQWHKAKIIAQGGKLEHWIDGELFCQVDLASPEFQTVLGKSKQVPEMVEARRGRIGLQFWEGSVAYRNVRIRAGAGSDSATGRPPAANPPRVGFPPPPPGEGLVDLIALVDPEKDAVTGHWRKEGDQLICEMWGVRANDLRNIVKAEYEAGAARIELPYEPPEEYDFRIVYTWKGRSNVDQILSKSGKSFTWGIGTFDNRWNGFSQIGGKMQNANPTQSTFSMVQGSSYTSDVQVRNDGIKGFVDGKLFSEWKTDYSDLSQEKFWQLRSDRVLGVGAWASDVTFTRIAVREVTGRGRILHPGRVPGGKGPGSGSRPEPRPNPPDRNGN